MNATRVTVPFPSDVNPNCFARCARSTHEAFPHLPETANSVWTHYRGPSRWTRPALAVLGLVFALGVLLTLFFSLLALALSA